MDFMTGLRVSSSGMTAQRRRMNAISSNIANINTTQTPEGGPYRRKQVQLEALPDAKSFADMMLTSPEKNVNRVQVTDVVSDRSAPLLKYEPDHPEANENGYVAYPNINQSLRHGQKRRVPTRSILSPQCYSIENSLFESASL